ncbi:MAG TPA: hypothetical protein DCQ83_00945 [Fibrobacteres bacterium]|jgi:hypothetical protein|nr:hypothetical protein [Fibrobacterota bacterium]
MDMELPGHTYSFKVLGQVYVSLIVLSALMVGFAMLPMEKLPIDWLDLHLVKRLLILGVAVAMAGIVAGFLMGLKYEKSKLNAVVFLTNFAFLLIFLLFVLADISFRGAMDPSFTKQLNWKSPVNAEEGSSGEASH